MDSLSQALLGASTFALVKDKHIGKSSLLIGAIAGSIPDLDILLSPFFNEVAFISVHRSVSHSIFFALLGSLLFGYIAHFISKKKYKYKDWSLAFFLAFFTHTLLDWCTTYGTKILSPVHGHLFSLNTIAIIEPIYTTILLIGVLALYFRPIKKEKRQKIIQYTLVFSTLYLVWAYSSKYIANYHFVAELKARNIPYKKILISPTPLNTILWNGIIKTEHGYYFGSYSLLDKRKNIELHFVKSENELLPKIQTFKKGKQYLEFTQDFPLIRTENDTVKIYAIKFGPINYFGKPEFVHPLCLNLDAKNDHNFKIKYSAKQKGPVNDYQELIHRIKGL